MKTIKITITFLLFFILKTSAQQITSAEIQVTGLTCSMCSQATEKSLKSLPAVGNVTPDLNKNVFVVSIKKDQVVNLDQLQKKVKDAGFSVGNMTATINFNDVKVDANGQAVVANNVYRFSNVKNKTLSGIMKVNVIDKNFLSSSAFKQKSATIKSNALASGSTIINGKKTRVYHLALS